MPDNPTFHRGDIVTHTRRPEWGEGVVITVTPIRHEDQPAHRLVIRFAHKGRVTLNTGIASLSLTKSQSNHASKPPQDPAPPVAEWLHPTATSPPPDSPDTPDHQNTPGPPQPTPLDPINNENDPRALTTLPESMTDPLASLSSRLRATLESYRFSSGPKQNDPPLNPRSLLDWAITQTGLHDPLSHHTRHDLDLAYERFAYQRHKHLTDLIRQVNKQGTPQLIHQILQETRDPIAHAALQSVSQH